MRLVDFKVRILTPNDGTEAVTRVMIESADGKGERWTTVGVSTNIIDASFNALHDAITWKLFRAGADAVRRDGLGRCLARTTGRRRADGGHRPQAGRRRGGAGDHPGRAAARREYRHGRARHAQLRPHRSAAGEAARRLAQSPRRVANASGADAVIEAARLFDSRKRRSPIWSASMPPPRAIAA